jgi:hypothetical protein
MYNEILSKGFIDCTKVSNYYLSKLDPATLNFSAESYALSFCNKQIH